MITDIVCPVCPPGDVLATVAEGCLHLAEACRCLLAAECGVMIDSLS